MFPQRRRARRRHLYDGPARRRARSIASPLKPELFDPKIVEFMKLHDFKDWLAKYKLTSS